MTQNERVLKYAEIHGSISALEAMQELGVMRLSARIFDLRKRGYVFTNKKERQKNRYGELVVFDRYVLKKEENENTDKQGTSV